MPVLWLRLYRPGGKSFRPALWEIVNFHLLQGHAADTYQRQRAVGRAVSAGWLAVYAAQRIYALMPRQMACGSLTLIQVSCALQWSSKPAKVTEDLKVDCVCQDHAMMHRSNPGSGPPLVSRVHTANGPPTNNYASVIIPPMPHDHPCAQRQHSLKPSSTSCVRLYARHSWPRRFGLWVAQPDDNVRCSMLWNHLPMS